MSSCSATWRAGTYTEAAQRLGCPLGTVQSRLARGRQRLRGRLARKGIEPATSAALLTDPRTFRGAPAAAGGHAASLRGGLRSADQSRRLAWDWSNGPAC